ncbi:MAG: hypothetical protein MRK02_10205 [Candidatus Scalindua sp.]|nr:hypothetical protein [Candidatus Scalindua sp.]
MIQISRIRKIVEGFKHAFAIDTEKLKDDEIALIEKLADYVVRRKMTLPAIMFLESVQPLNFIGNQAALFFKPILIHFFSAQEYNKLINILEKRDAIKTLIRQIEKRVNG